ncbi:MAG: SDR family NAD(P)-dependent oxidoreductase, partial [Actinomycetota bacterium]
DVVEPGEVRHVVLHPQFARLDDVRALASGLAALDRIDVLVNNAGGIFGHRSLTVDGFEKTMQVNHLAPFLLTALLLDTLLASGAVVVNTSSVAAKRFGSLDLGHLGNEAGYSPEKAYGDSKLANILHARELHNRFAPQGLAAASFHPGGVATNFAAESTSRMRWFYHTPLRRVLLSSEKGADTLIWLAEGEAGRDWRSGEYYEKKRVAKSNPQAYDDSLAHSLWELSAEMVGVQA